MAPRSSKHSKRPTPNDPFCDPFLTVPFVADSIHGSATSGQSDHRAPTPSFRPYDELSPLSHSATDETGHALLNPMTGRPHTSLTQYIKEIKQFPLLTPEEEQRIGTQIKQAHNTLIALITRLHAHWKPHSADLGPLWPLCQGLVRADRWNPHDWEQMEVLLHTWTPPATWRASTRNTVVRLCARIKTTHQVWARLRNHFIATNLRLVVHVARYYSRTSVPFADLIQVGNIGLIQAIDRFDPDIGTRLSTYSVAWIREAMYRLITTSITHATPLLSPDHHEHDPYELAPTYLASLDITPLSGEDDDNNLLSLIPDRQLQTPIEDAVAAQLRDRIQHALKTLDPDEQQILVLRHGLAAHPSHTLDEIAKKMAITRDQVRHKQLQAYHRLRNGPYRDVLREFLDE